MWVERLKKKLLEKKISKKGISEQIGMSEQNLYKCFKRNSIETKHLYKIADILEVPVSYFFEESKAEVKKIIGNGNNVNIGKNNGNNKTHTACDKYKIELKGLKKEIKFLEEKIKDKEEIIELLKKGG